MFSPDWLSLREPADAAARSEALTRSLADALPDRGLLRVLDLASGTGANARYLFERLRSRQEWLLADHDPALLAAAPAQMISWARSRGVAADRTNDEIRLSVDEGTWSRFTIRRADLSTLEDGSVFRDRQLVTASALLDLVSEPWLQHLARNCREAGATAFFTLTYNGRIECDPIDPDDEMVQELVNRHQRSDKGFGAALGPTAVDAAERIFAETGYLVRRASSDWALAPGAAELQRQLIDGWAAAARETDPERSNRIEEWRRRRRAAVERQSSSIIVGHEDILAVRQE